MSFKRAKHDAFQIELNEALRNRRKKEEINPQLMEETETEDDDDTDYSDDEFDDDDDSLLNAYTKPIVQSKTEKSSTLNPKEKLDWYSSSSFMDEDDSDIFGSTSRFLKGKKENKSNTKPTTDKFSTSVGKFDAPYNEYSVVKDHDSLPKDKALTDFLNFESSREVPTPARRGIDKKRMPVDDDIPRQQRAMSPYYTERAKSPSSGSVTPTRRKTPDKGHRSPVRSPDHSLDALKAKQREELFSVKSRGSEKEQKVMKDTRPKPVGSGKSSPIQGILNAMKSSTVEDNSSPRHQPLTRSKDKASDKPQSYVNFLLESEQPKPVPRKIGSKSPEAEPLKLPRKSLSPTFSKDKEDRSILKKEKSSDSLNQYRSQSPDNKRSKSPIQHLILPRNQTTSFPSLPATSQQANPRTASSLDIIPKDSKSEKAQSKAEADDILALFNQATSSDPPDIDALLQQKQSEKVVDGRKTPVEEVIQRTSDQQIQGDMKQRLSRQVMDNAIDVVAEHNAILDVNSMSSKDEEVKKPPKRKSKKSYRTPPANYQGLGSLTMLKELKKGKNTEDEQEDIHANTEDIRKKVYLEWLARREAETKKKKQEEAKKKKEIQEKEVKEREDKKAENEIVRRKWEEAQKQRQNEKQKEKRRKEKLKREDQEIKEKQKLKSKKDAEKKRSLMMEYAKREHEAEKKEKLKKERECKKKEEEQKVKNEKALNEWQVHNCKTNATTTINLYIENTRMNERSEKWLSDRKQEQHKKKKQEDKEKKKKQKAANEAEERYNRWREHKDNELKASLRESKQQLGQRMIYTEDEENYQPPWSPPSKVIPRRR